MRIAISYDNFLPHTTGNYFSRAFSEVAETHYVHPKILNDLSPIYDLYIKIDDGIHFNKWNPNLHPSVYYIIDSHIDSEKNWRRGLISESNFDYLLTAQKNGGTSLDIDSKWIPLGCDPVLHKPINKNGKLYDTCFIGNFHSEFANKRLDYVETLLKNFPNFFFGTRFFNEMAQKFSESRIVFNQSLNQDINMRIFEACASGSMQLTSRIHNNGIEELYTEGKHYIAYDDLDEMIDKAKYYLEHEAEREAISESGMEHTLSNHTYKHRAERILKEVLNA